MESQYDRFAEEFVKGTDIFNEPSRDAYYRMLDFEMRDKSILDVGCGDGYDMLQYEKKGAIAYGIDISRELIELARKKVPNAKLHVGLMEELPYKNAYFDIVLSKYAIQTSKNVPQVLSEMDRVLKPGGILAYLAVHPLRQFLEKKKHPKDYFIQEIVESTFFNGLITAKEPTHTINEYLNSEFLKKFKLLHFEEHTDFPSSEKIDGDTYPCFFVLKAQKNID